MTIKQLYVILKFININRYRLFSYKDYSKPIVLLFFYVLALKNLWRYESIYSLYILFLLLISQCVYLQNRNDFEFFKKKLKYPNIIIIYFFDLFILNTPILFLISIKSFEFLIYSIISIFIFSFLHNNYSIKKIPLPFLKKDPVWTTYFRKNPFIFFILIILYYILYEGLVNQNYNLIIFSIIVLLIIILSVLNNREEIIFIKLSKLSIEKYLLKIIKIYLINSLIIFIPIVILLIVYNTLTFQICFLYTFSVIVLVNLKYLFFNKELTHGISSFLYIFLVAYFLNHNISIIEYILITVLVGLIYYISVNNLKNFINHINL